MKHFFLILVTLLMQQTDAATIKGTIYNASSQSKLMDCTILLMENDIIVSKSVSSFEGAYSVSLKKSKHYTLEVLQRGYETFTIDFIADDSFIESNKTMDIKLKPLSINPNFDDLKKGVIKPTPNPDIMEDIGTIDSLPEGYKIIEAVPLKIDKPKTSGFNVNLGTQQSTNVNVNVLKEAFNKESLMENVYSEKDKFPSSYYAEGIVYYGEGKALLTPSVKEILDGLAIKLNSDAKIKVKIAAYADANRELKIADLISKMRVEEITKYLMSKDVLFSQLEIKIMGNQDLENGCYENVDCGEFEHQQNRKVTISFIK